MDNQWDLLHSTGNSAQCCVSAWMGREFEEEYIHITCVIESFYCPPETITLLIGYTPKQHKEFSLKKQNAVIPQCPEGIWNLVGTRICLCSSFLQPANPIHGSATWMWRADCVRISLIKTIDILGFCDLFEKYQCYWKALLVAQMVKNPAVMWETWVWSLGWEDPLEGGMATSSSILAWRIPMDRGAQRALAHGVSKSWTQPSN